MENTTEYAVENTACYMRRDQHTNDASSSLPSAVEDVVVAGLVEEVYLGSGALREVVVVDGFTLAPRQVLDPHRYPGRRGQGRYVDVVTLLAHGLHLLQ